MQSGLLGGQKPEKKMSARVLVNELQEVSHDGVVQGVAPPLVVHPVGLEVLREASASDKSVVSAFNALHCWACSSY